MTSLRALPAVPDGPRAFRSRLRRLGALAALTPAALLGGVGVLALHGNVAASRGVLGFAAVVLAAPLLLTMGIPHGTGSGRILLGVVLSVVLWMLVGVLAARRATRSPVATWRDFWREYAWLAFGIWLGVGVSLGVIELLVGRLLL